MKNITVLLIMLAFIGLLIGANIYLSRRFAQFFEIENVRVLYIIFAAITLFMFFGIALLTNSKGWLANKLYATAAITLGFMLYLIFSVLLVDLFRIFIKIPSLYSGVAVLTIAGLVSVYGIINAFNVRIKNLDIKIDNLQQEINIMHWTDVHLGHFRSKKFLQKLVDKTNQADVDVLFITGDLFDGRINLKESNLEPLKQLYIPIYFVHGNHDGYTGVEEIKTMMRKIGVHVLENETSQLGDLQIIGLNHMLADSNSVNMHGAGHAQTISSVLPTLQINKDMPSVLLHHSPDGMKYVSEQGIDLYLAGHTHAGQLFPINLLNNRIFEYNKGLHHLNGSQIYVSSGAGTFGPPMRVGTQSEITKIKLVSNDE